MDIHELVRTLKESSPASVYLVAGEEEALVDRALAMLKNCVLDKTSAKDFALTRLDARATSAQEVETVARSLSLFGGRRLVILHHAQSLRAEEQKKLKAYLTDPIPTTTLVLEVRGVGAESRDPKRAKAANSVKQLKKAVEQGGGICVECPKPKPRDLPRLARQLLGEHKLTTDQDGLYALVEAVGEDLGGLIQAAEKLSLYLGDRSKVTARDVAEVVADTRSQSIFALTDAVGERSKERALRVLSGMIRDGANALMILGQLARHWRNLAWVQALSTRGENQENIRRALGLHPFVVKKCLAQTKRLPAPMLAARLAVLGEADLQLKCKRFSERLVLEKLVLSLCEQS